MAEDLVNENRKLDRALAVRILKQFKLIKEEPYTPKEQDKIEQATILITEDRTIREDIAIKRRIKSI